MQLTQLMDEHYKGLALTPGVYHSLDLGIHIRLGGNIYQLKDDGTLNMKRFHTAYGQVAEIFPLLCNKSDDVIVVVNSYPSETKKTTYPNFFRRYVKDHRKKYALRLQELPWRFDEENFLVQQMELLCKVSDLKVESLLNTIINEDFPSLKPQLRKKNSLFAPDVFIVNVRTKCIFHIYDDRGCEIMNADEQLHNKCVDYFNGWEIEVKA